MTNPFYQLLLRLTRSAASTGDPPAPDPSAEDPPIDDAAPGSPEPPLAEPTESVAPAAAALESSDPPATSTEIGPAESYPPTDNPRTDPAPVDIPWTERALLDGRPPAFGGSLPDDPRASSSLLKGAPGFSHEDTFDEQSGSNGSLPAGAPGFSPEAGAEPAPRTRAAAAPAGDVPEWPSYRPETIAPPHSATETNPRETSTADRDESFSNRIERLLASLEQHPVDQDRSRTLNRLDEILKRLLDSQLDLPRFAERLDQLETALLLRGRG